MVRFITPNCFAHLLCMILFLRWLPDSPRPAHIPNTSHHPSLLPQCILQLPNHPHLWVFFQVWHPNTCDLKHTLLCLNLSSLTPSMIRTLIHCFILFLLLLLFLFLGVIFSVWYFWLLWDRRHCDGCLWVCYFRFTHVFSTGQSISIQSDLDVWVGMGP